VYARTKKWLGVGIIDENEKFITNAGEELTYK
jgi:hypothetical protein